MDAPVVPLATPSTLSPSKLERFVSCPLSFRYAYIDRLPQPSTIHQVRGTVVHAALQRLFGDRPATRTPAAAKEALAAAWEELAQTDELRALELDEAATATLLGECATLLSRYFELEDPTGVHPVGLELDLRCRLEGVELRGIIDRLDRHDDGEFAVVDYKTGRAPSTDHSRGRLGGVNFYALLCEQVLGRRPREVRLVYLRDRVVITQTPTDQSMRGTRQRALAVWAAIERSCASGDFRPNPSRLCDYCGFRGHCPAAGASRVAETMRTNAAVAAQ